MSRDAFLNRVRQALHEGHRPAPAPPLQPRGRVGYQGGGPDPVARFAETFAAAGGFLHRFDGPDPALAFILEMLKSKAARQALVGTGPVIDRLRLPEKLPTIGVQAVAVDTLRAADGRDQLFAADVGITGVDYLIAETGSVVVLSKPEEPRSLSLLPPVHIAVAAPGQIVPDLFDLFEKVGAGPDGPRLPSCLTLITGPSKTGDIELKLVTGVHGPGEVHLVLIEG